MRFAGELMRQSVGHDEDACILVLFAEGWRNCRRGCLLPHAAMSPRESKPASREMVVLTRIPPGLLDGLPQEDQNAIVAIVGKPVFLAGYDEDGRAELRFDDPFDRESDDHSHTHSIWVEPEFIERLRM